MKSSNIKIKKLTQLLIDNKPLAINSAVVILIGLLTLLAQYSESKINDYKNELLLIQNQANNLLITKIDLLTQGNLSQIYFLHGIQSGRMMGNDSPYADPELVALGLEFQNKTITAQTFLTKRTEIYYNKANEIRNQYNEKATHLSERLKSRSTWEYVNMATYPLLLLLVLISGILNVLLYRSK